VLGMSDLILGMGEVGSTIYSLLEEKDIHVQGYDKDETKCRMADDAINPDFMHVCIPYTDGFVTSVSEAISRHQPRAIIVHSTVKVGTTAIVSRLVEGKIPVFYSPVRGVHERFLKDIKDYGKFISPLHAQYEERLLDRFDNIVWSDNTDALELAKIMETTYYGYLIAFRKDVDDRFSKMKLDSDVFWAFCEEIQEKLGNRPVMFNDGEPIGGHCVIPNLKLLPDEFNIYKEIIGRWGRD
jgi:UDP-N-acetyl-D-mannosaminuronate dehydrogenase